KVLISHQTVVGMGFFTVEKEKSHQREPGYLERETNKKAFSNLLKARPLLLVIQIILQKYEKNQ
ncbi:MAG: hypothetical protein R3255_04860, partial [Candidatus Lokiarchaeia archaeon]|nr:hypothetical protein [Candidatus Lokiarchaeia archaeon]